MRYMKCLDIYQPNQSPSSRPHLRVDRSHLQIDRTGGHLTGVGIDTSIRRLGELAQLFDNEDAFQSLDQSQVVYRVEAFKPIPQGTPGGLYFGTTFIEPGKVGDEYFMTKGHLHDKQDASEYYWGIQGQGVLILMDENRRCWGEHVTSGSLHFIPGNVAHRLANIGDSTLVVGACWLADAGHNYSTITQGGFAARLKSVEEEPKLVPVESG